ncbi:MAG TPA: SGNH/GDSL hydrolase family protein [Planctomycetota bacterium]|nr:SGNH/GDSL hydrolase family protein [Planctomycetota bacterium]
MSTPTPAAWRVRLLGAGVGLVLAAATALCGLAVVDLTNADPMLVGRLGGWRPALIAISVWAGLACAKTAIVCAARPRGGEVAAALMAMPPAFVVAAFLQLVVLQPYLPPLATAAGAAGAGIFATFVAAARADRLTRTRRIVVRISAALLVFVFASEAGLRLLSKVRPSPLLSRDDLDAQFIIDSFRFHPGQIHNGFVCNSAGYFDDEFTPKREGRFLAVAIGDSFSSGPVPHEFHFTTIAERLLGDGDVDNLGVPGIGPREYLHLLRTEVLALRPDVVVVDLFLGNDVEESSRALDRGRARWFDRANYLFLVVPQRLARLASEGKPLERVGSPIAPTASVPAQDLLRTYPFLGNPLLEDASFSPEQFLWIESTRAKAICGADESRYPPLFECLAKMRDATLAAGSRFAVLLIPDEFQVEDAVWKDVTAKAAPMPLDRDKPQRLIGEWLARERIPAADLLPALRGLQPLGDGRRHAYHLRDTHFNARGNEIAGRALAEFLRTLR